MEACVLEEDVSRADRAVLDNRYFCTKAGLGQCESGLARRAITAFLRKHSGGGIFVSQKWYNIIEYVGYNASVLGFYRAGALGHHTKGRNVSGWGQPGVQVGKHV